MATLHFAVLKSRQTVKKTYTIYLAVTHNRDVRYISTEFEIDDLFQFDKGKVVCRKDAMIMNQRLSYVLSEYQQRLDCIPDKGIYNCSQLKEILENRQKLARQTTIKEYMQQRIANLRKEGRNSYADMNEYTLDKILSIIGNVSLQSFNSVIIDRFIKGMSSLSNATKQMRLTHLKACLNEAIREGLVKYEVHPFAYTKMPKSPAKLLDLTIEEFTRIRDLATRHKKLSLARDLFLLSFYLGGINLADLVEADVSGNQLKYVRRKTANKKQGEKTISYSNFQRYLNHCLKKLGKELNIQSNISYYSARKTFSQFAFDLGIRTEIIEYCLGQSMKENRLIYNYVRIMQRQADAAIRKVIDCTNDPDKFELDVISRID